MSEPDLSTLTHRLANLTRRAMGERMAHERWALEAGFRPGCVGVLQVVAATEPVSQREVSDRLLLDPSDLVSLVDILERAGLVERRRDPADRRRYALATTEAGRRAAARLRQVAREAHERVLAPLDDDERRRLADLLSRIVEHHSGLVIVTAGEDADRPAETTGRPPEAEPVSARRAGPAPRSAGS